MVAVREVGVRLLGEPALVLDGQPVPFRTARVAALVGFLAAHRGRPCPRSTIAEALWPGRPSDLSHQSLRQTLLYLRQGLGEAAEAVVATRNDLRLRPEAVESDLAALARHGEERTPEGLRRAVALYRGPFLQGIDDEWAIPFRTELAAAFRRALLDLSDRAVADDPNAALAYAERAVAEEPFHDGARARKLRALRALGEDALALREFEAYEAMLMDELGLRPARIVEEALSAEQARSEPEPPPSEFDAAFRALESAPGDARRLAVSLAPYWIATGRASTGLRRLDSLRDVETMVLQDDLSTAEFTLAAAALALSTGDAGRAIDEARAVLASSPDDRPRVRALTILTDALFCRDARTETRRAALAGLRLGRRLSPPPPLSRLWNTLSILHRLNGAPTRAAATLRRARACAGSPIESARTGLLIAQSHLDGRDVASAQATLEEILTLVEGDETPSACAFRASVARHFEELGDGERARRGYERAVEEGRRAESRWGLAVSLTYLGDLLTETGEPARAIPLHEEARTIRVAIGDEVGEATSLRGLGVAYLELDDPAAARPPLREAIRLYSQIDSTPRIAGGLLRLAQAEARAGERDLALRLARRAAHLLRGLDGPQLQTIGPRSERLLPEAEALVRELGG